MIDASTQTSEPYIDILKNTSMSLNEKRIAVNQVWGKSPVTLSIPKDAFPTTTPQSPAAGPQTYCGLEHCNHGICNPNPTP